MNVLMVFVAGVAAGWVTDKLYRSFVGKRQCCEDDIILNEKNVGDSIKKDVDKTAQTADKYISGDITDDLSVLKGVGPKLEGALDEIGIHNYEQLSSSPVDELLERLRETGGRFTMASISSVVERAKLATAERSKVPNV